MIIIFEGADQTGKSSIAKELSRQLNIPYFKNQFEHVWVKQGKMLESLIFGGTMVLDFIVSSTNSAIIDRFHGSEFVYSKVFERDTDWNTIFWQDLVLAIAGAKIVYCYKENNANYEDYLVSKEQNEKVKKWYEQFLGMTKCEVLRLETSDYNLERQVDAIKVWLENASR